MKVLVTGGTGVVGQAAVNELLKHGHTIRLLSRNAKADAQLWPDGVESCPAAISDQSGLRGCAEGCDPELHVAGITEESPPALTYESVNVAGTRSIVSDAARSKLGPSRQIASSESEAGIAPVP